MTFLTGVGIVLGCGAVFGFWEYLLYRRRERRLKELTLYLLKLQDGVTLPEFSSYAEGQLGVLQSEIYKLVTLLGERSEKSGRESAYLARMMSDISHQIKTPLAAVTLLTDLLKEPELSKEKRLEFAQKIDSQTGKITWLTRNLLTLAQLEADMLKLKRESVTAGDLLRRACAPLEILAEMRRVAIVLEDEAGMNRIPVACDPGWTGEAFSNIVKNCIEHTGGAAKGAGAPAGKGGDLAAGHVWIAAEWNNFGVTVTIRDDGSGIPAEDLPHIFERFYKGKGASKSSVGIGLAMARQIIMQQNGVIDVKSSEGSGTMFTVRLYEELRERV